MKASPELLRSRRHDRPNPVVHTVWGVLAPPAMRCLPRRPCAGVRRRRPLWAQALLPLPPPPSSPTSPHGKKRALLVGISYKRSWKRLEGSVNDVNCMKFLLQRRFGFPEPSILVLTDGEGNPRRTPTRENILEAMRWLVSGCRRGDSLVFHFSGHGSQLADKDGDELDGYDETLCPVDYQKSGAIVDDMVNAILVRPLPQGVTLHAVVDACHSGSALDLPFVCNMNSGGLAVCFSSCGDDQTSSETNAFSGNATTGAMTYCFIKAVERGSARTYGSLLLNIRKSIRKSEAGAAVPQLSSSERFDVNQKLLTL
ncbi:unnamed protein product [Spirodela intermedia]|uniref:Peptidase C14 caspase domain-containing protein n=1 Tax=Spirodela intermedia TaxID=51605 RepID=A0A7I8IP99_SPIIN|nr:unnamed protein product [Spirodela intermedia]CAA6658830.1 unnamed protein product [Spirodela intermedia]